jgi:hypothetical protein
MKFKPETGWQESMSPNALINLRGQGRGEEAKQRLRTRGENRFADGGVVPITGIDFNDERASEKRRQRIAEMNRQFLESQQPQTDYPKSFDRSGKNRPKEKKGKHLVHYSQSKKVFPKLDPSFYGEGRAGVERERGNIIPRTYFYEAESAPEHVVTRNAKHRYMINRPDNIIDLASDEAKELLSQVGSFNEFEEHIKNLGYDGYKNSAHSEIPNAVALFHPQDPIHIEPTSSNYAHGGGLYANIHAKQRRIAHGSGEHMRKPGKEGAPTAEAFEQAAKTAHLSYGGGVHYYAEGPEEGFNGVSADDNMGYGRSPATERKVIESDDEIDAVRNAVAGRAKYDVDSSEESPDEAVPEQAMTSPQQPAPRAPQAPSEDVGENTHWTSYGENEIPQNAVPIKNFAPQAKAPDTPQNQHKSDTAKFYNMLAAAKYSSTGPESSYDPGIMNYMYGPNGESPKQFDSELYEQAEKKSSDKQMEEYNEYQQQELARAKENDIRRRANQPLLPSVSAPNQAGSATAGNLNPPVTTGKGNLGDKIVPKDTFGYDEYMNTLLKGKGFGVTSILQGTTAAKKKAELEEKAYGQSVGRIKRVNEIFENSLIDTNKDYREALDKLNSTEIKNDFLHNKGVGAKIGVAIGMALAGFGGQGQVAMDYIKKQIENDLEVQKQNMGRTQTALGMIRDHYQSLSTAIPMYQALALGQTTERIKQIATQMGTPEADANANALINKLYMDIAPKLKEAAGYRMLQNLANPENGGAIDEADIISKMQAHPDPTIRAVGEGLGPKVVSGYKRPPNTPTETTLTVIRNSDTFEDLAKDVMQFANTLGPIGKLTPEQRSIAQAKVVELRNALVATYPPGSGGTAEEREAIERAIQNPVNFLYGIKGGAKSLEAILNSVRTRKATFEKIGNLVPRESSPQQKNIGSSFKPAGR